jgi:hypothetical protein
MSVVQSETPVFELEDSWEQINAWFLQRDLTDGLPIVPPTEERVRAVTDYVHETLGWSASDAIGKLAPKNGVATVEKIAANALGTLSRLSQGEVVIRECRHLRWRPVSGQFSSTDRPTVAPEK